VGGIGLSSNVQSWPYLEVKETDDQVIVTAELPGLTEKDVDVTVDDGVLTLRGEEVRAPGQGSRLVRTLLAVSNARSCCPTAPTRRTARACYAMAC
jgi:HSP20 family molecular chaperone IbpA